MTLFKKIIFLLLILVICSCASETESTSFRIGFSQAMTTDNWRKQMNRSMQVEASLHPGLQLEIKDAQNDVQRQIEQIESLIEQGVDVLIVSPIQSQPITPVIEKAMNTGIPTIVIDRKIEGSNYTSYIGADNVEIGKNAANFILSHSNGEIEVVEITGLKGSSPAYERSEGFASVIQNANEVKLASQIRGDWEKASVKKQLENILDSIKTPDFIFAHNDRMALGAWEVARSRNLEDDIKIIGVDGLFGPSGGIQLVKEGLLTATILYPTGGGEAIKLADRILSGENVPKNNILSTVIIDSVNVDIMQNQFNRINQQQYDIEKQQEIIGQQLATYRSQSILIKVMIGLSMLLFILGLWAGYLVYKLKKSKRKLEINNKKIKTQRNQIETFAEKLQIINESKINFFTALSHEFKTPLSLIISSIESITDRENKNIQEFSYETSLIVNNSKRLLRLIDELLDFRKLESGNLKPRPVKTGIIGFLQNIYEDFKSEALRKSIQLEFKAPRNEVEVYIDRNMMDKVFYNILSNALKFTPHNGKILIKIEESTKNSVEIRIKDSGIGIPKEEWEQIFDPFRQASNNARPSSGLGLYISKQYIELHKGKIEVYSHQGSEFKITILKGDDHLKEYEVEKNDPGNTYQKQFETVSPPEIGEVTLPENAESILIIEDNPDLSHLLSKKFSNRYKVYLSDGRKAVEMALDLIPDIIICDLNLPEKSGFEISRELKNDLRTSHIPTIILTALNDEESRLKALKAGADAYITKPFNFEILLESLRTALYNREKLRYYYTNRIDRIADENFEDSEQQFLKELNEHIQNNLKDPDFSVEELARLLKISRVQLYRKVKALLDMSISEYINEQRLRKARHLLQDTSLNISEIAYSVGFSSPGYFSTSFKNKYGESPKQFRK
ncbi:substrate-binding domain-containing protein [Salegentibacter flavus]|uniref:histidine kinase n=1 Tax=Salegentibacter flavus TaxID=287099 RepID=A0A1I4ZDV8_9FLAO|nr:substrate-binding domain-containing protein [Salegentibacter flavus]SFN48213.1 monosaccharide ABC transporter substrate-binding protein, CUT2 family (TC 3.A.1.2.-) [Salegentibacter flavus]